MSTEPVDVALQREDIRSMSISNSSSPRFSERKLILELIDLLMLNMSFFVALNLRPDINVNFESLISHIHWFIILSGIWIIYASTLGCYNLSRAARLLYSSGSTIAAVILTWLTFSVIPYVTPVLPAKRMQALAFPVVGIGCITIWRMIYAAIFVRMVVFQQSALIIGAGSAGKTLIHAIHDMSHSHEKPHHSIGYQILGFIDDDLSKRDLMIEGISVVGTHHDLVRLAQQLRVNEIVVAITRPEKMHERLFDSILECRELGISIVTMPKRYEQLTGRVPIEHASRDLYVAFPLGQSATYRFYVLSQRIYDIIGSLFGCLLVLAVMPFVWLANYFSSSGPLFYSQERVGKGGRKFTIYKFRSMVVNAEKLTGAVWATNNDPRITRIGRFLRKTRVDELPQFWNVLKGEMSLVGPRPERPHFVDQLAKQIPVYRAKHAVKPGVTGWTQVKCRYGSSVKDHLFRLQHDLYYIKNQSIVLDIEIILKTIPVMLGFKGR